MFLSSAPMLDDESAARPRPLPVKERKLRRSSADSLMVSPESSEIQRVDLRHEVSTASDSDRVTFDLKDCACRDLTRSLSLPVLTSICHAGISTAYPASIHALVPPVTFITLVKPACCAMPVAALERKPPAQMIAVGLFGSRFKRGKSSRNCWSGAVVARGAWPLWYSAGRRTSTTCRSGCVSIRFFKQATLICGTNATSNPASFHARMKR